MNNLTNNVNPKIAKRRLIAERVLLSTFGTLLVFGAIGLGTRSSIDDDVSEIRGEQTKIYQEFEDSAEFDTEFKQDFKTLSNDYVVGNISFEQFEDGLTHLKSQEYVKQVFDQKASRDMTDKIEQLDAQIDDIKNNSKRAKVNSAIAPLALASGVANCGAIIYWATNQYKSQFGKEQNEEKQTKQEDEQTL